MTPFIGEIRIFGFNFAPLEWAPCDGRLLPIDRNQTLFARLGTSFGGDGKTNFALPDLRSMIEPFKPLMFCIATQGVYPTPDPDPNARTQLGGDVPFLSEVNMFGFGFAPAGWASCNGSSIAIRENPALFSLVGTAFGGDGRTNFNLPDLRGMVAPFKPLTFCIATGGAFPTSGKPPPGSGAYPYIGEVRMLGCNFAPHGWASCDGRLLPIKLGWKSVDKEDPYQVLFSLVGTTFGGDGNNNFAVPDLRGMVAPFKPLTFCIAAEDAIGIHPQKPSGG